MEPKRFVYRIEDIKKLARYDEKFISAIVIFGAILSCVLIAIYICMVL